MINDDGGRAGAVVMVGTAPHAGGHAPACSGEWQKTINNFIITIKITWGWPEYSGRSKMLKRAAMPGHDSSRETKRVLVGG
jgi:hypothetical protein